MLEIATKIPWHSFRYQVLVVSFSRIDSFRFSSYFGCRNPFDKNKGYGCRICSERVSFPLLSSLDVIIALCLVQIRAGRCRC